MIILRKEQILLLLISLFFYSLAWSDPLNLWGDRFVKDIAVILPLSQGNNVLKQCSRVTPEHVTRFWQPSKTDIEQLEKDITGYLYQREISNQTIPYLNLQYARQYIGLELNGERLIYGNFLPYDKSITRDSLKVVSMICDDGPKWWGVSYNRTTQTFQDLAFDGPLEGQTDEQQQEAIKSSNMPK
jgi:hypothetical protein